MRFARCIQGNVKFQDLRRKNDETKAIKVPRKRIRRRKKGMKSEEPAQTSREQLKEQEHHWNELKQYFGVNDRFHPPACSSPPPKSGLEKSIERAIAEGDIAKAEEMSDRLATREVLLLDASIYVPHVTVVDRLIYKSGDIVVKQKKCIEGVLEASLRHQTFLHQLTKTARADSEEPVKDGRKLPAFELADGSNILHYAAARISMEAAAERKSPAVLEIYPLESLA